MLPARDWMGGTREEYETQHFGFGSQRLGIAMRGVIEDNIATNVREMETSLLHSMNLTDDVRGEVTRAHDQLISLYCTRAGPAVKRIDTEIEKLLEIPENTILPEDEHRAARMTDDEYRTLRSEVAALQQRVQRGALMEALLSAEEEELRSIEKHCELAQQTMLTLERYGKQLTERGGVVKRVVGETRELCSPFAFIKSTFL